jgi:hypothetical protein
MELLILSVIVAYIFYISEKKKYLGSQNNTQCREGYQNIGGVCYETCKDATDVGALCREKCREGYKEIAGICYKNCNGVDTGLLCREHCRDGYKDVGGVCWKECNGVDTGLLCREHCRDGYKDVGGVCWEKCPDGYRDDGATCMKDLKCTTEWNSCKTKSPKWLGGKCIGSLDTKCSGPEMKNKNSYIPKTIGKGSYIPKTLAKENYIPKTSAKKSYEEFKSTVNETVKEIESNNRNMTFNFISTIFIVLTIYLLYRFFLNRYESSYQFYN